uniref:Uncharacterized protein n=1 Tax=Arundo donax TaxID=35708 RepID=A0A0A9ANN7_ARUDO
MLKIARALQRGRPCFIAVRYAQYDEMAMKLEIISNRIAPISNV